MAHVGKFYPYHPRRDYSIIDNFRQICAKRYQIRLNSLTSSPFVTPSTELWISSEGEVDEDAGTIEWVWGPGGWPSHPCTYLLRYELTFNETAWQWYSEFSDGTVTETRTFVGSQQFGLGSVRTSDCARELEYETDKYLRIGTASVNPIAGLLWADF